MAFMQPQIYETDYIEIDGPYGVEVVPCDVDNFDVPEIKQWPKQGDCEDDKTVPSPLALYCENKWAYTIERKHGFVARMSAPGYTDCTEWSAHKTKKAAREFLDEMYGEDDA